MSTEPTVADVFWAQIARVEAIKLAKDELLPRLAQASNITGYRCGATAQVVVPTPAIRLDNIP